MKMFAKQHLSAVRSSRMIKYLREEGKIAYLQGHCGLEER